MDTMLTRIVTTSLIAILAAIVPAPCRADFLMTMASGVYQDTSGQVKVILGTKPGAGRGLFVMAGPPVSPQEFNVENTPKEGYRHVFIRFDDDASPPVYSELWVGNHAYRINGNLTLTLGGLATVSIDNNNPYLSIVTDGGASNSKASILAFSGLTEVVRGAGPATDILAANQLDPEVARVIRPYEITEHELVLMGKPVSTPMIGTFVRPDSECLNATAIVLTNTQLAQVQAARNEEARVKILDQVMKDNRKSSPLKGHLVLKTDPKSVVLLDIQEKNVKEMHPIKGAAGKRKLCVLSDLALG